MKCENPERCGVIEKKRRAKQSKSLSVWDKRLQIFLDELSEDTVIIKYSNHYQKRKQERLIFERDVIEVLENGGVIEKTKHGDRNRILVFSYVKKGKRYRPVHVALEIQPYNTWEVVTVYCPNSQPWKWSKTLDERICFCKKEGF